MSEMRAHTEMDWTAVKADLAEVLDALRHVQRDVLWATRRLPMTLSTAAPEQYEDEPSQMCVRLRRALGSLDHATQVVHAVRRAALLGAQENGGRKARGCVVAVDHDTRAIMAITFPEWGGLPDPDVLARWCGSSAVGLPATLLLPADGVENERSER